MADPAAPVAPRERAARERRTVALAALLMLVLVVAGVVAGSLWAASGCRALAPRPLDVALVRADAEVGGLEPALAGLASELGGVAVRLALPAGERLLVVEGGVAVVDGPGEAPATLTVVDDDGSVRSVSRLGEGATVVGGGASPYALDVPNRSTGQVDALAALDVAAPTVARAPCLDAAVVGSPLAFLLDAGDGRLLLLRTAEDGSEVDVELRDPIVGRRWAARLAPPRAPAGLVAARTTAVLAAPVAGESPEGLVAVALRSGPVAAAGVADAGDGAVVVALDAADGTERWRVGRTALESAGAVDPATTVDVELVGVTADEVVVLVGAAVDELRPAAFGPLGTALERAARRGTLVGLERATGRVTRVVPAVRPSELAAVRAAGPHASQHAAVVRELGTAALDVVVARRTWVLVAADDGPVLVGFGR